MQAPQSHNPFPPPQPAFQQYPQPLQPQALQPQAPQPQLTTGDYRRDDEAVIAAQKHAKWAISALNFEDVDTAVKELRIALRALGAS
jgi:vacuolar protein sorting-associated protein VTA1